MYYQLAIVLCQLRKSWFWLTMVRRIFAFAIHRFMLEGNQLRLPVLPPFHPALRIDG
ncbi:hypothetical protein [Nostoc sp.]|uniref:hypothetical protein n=1 Tax=Nostoc sp. TaxID=1180 RepID=UPI002FF65005